MRSRASSLVIFFVAVMWSAVVLFIANAQPQIKAKSTVMGRAETSIRQADAGQVKGETVSSNAGLPYGQTSTFFGSMSSGDGMYRTQTFFDNPQGIAVAEDGTAYIADTANHRIRKIDADGIVTTLAGTTRGFRDDSGAKAQFSDPSALAVTEENVVYVADMGNGRIRKISDLGVTTTIASGSSSPQGIAVYGTTVYFSDSGHNVIKKVSTSGGSVTTITKKIKNPGAIVLSADGKTAYVVSRGTHQIFSIDTTSRKAKVFAGSGTWESKNGAGTVASFGYLAGLTLSGKKLYATETNGSKSHIRVIDTTSAQVSTFFDASVSASSHTPVGITASSGSLYVANQTSGTITRYGIGTGITEIFAGSTAYLMKDGSNGIGLVGRPDALRLSSDASLLYVAANNQLLQLDVATQTISTIIGSTKTGYREGTAVGASAVPARFDSLKDVVLSSDGKTAYMSDSNNNRIRKILLAENPITSSYVAGAGRVSSADPNGYAEGKRCDGERSLGHDSCAYFSHPTGLAISKDDRYIYVADTGNNRIRKVDVTTGATTLVAGSGLGFRDGTGASAHFNAPQGLALDARNTYLYVADTGNNRIRRITLSTGKVSTIAGSKTAGLTNAVKTQAQFSSPTRLALDQTNHLYISDSGNAVVRVLYLPSGLVELASGSGKQGYIDASRSTTRFEDPAGLALDASQDTLYVADSTNDVIRSVIVHSQVSFSKNPSVPVSISPATIKMPRKNTVVQLHGTHFRSGMVVYLGSTIVDVTVKNSTTASLVIPVFQKSGRYDVLVITPDTQMRVQENILRISDTTGAVPDTHFATPSSTSARNALSH